MSMLNRIAESVSSWWRGTLPKDSWNYEHHWTAALVHRGIESTKKHGGTIAVAVVSAALSAIVTKLLGP